ncbi:MAG: DUF3943 domain-containing protein [Myxococcota bacterium]
MENDAPDLAGAAIEAGVLWGLGTAWYIAAVPSNSSDWHYDLSWDTAQKKLFTGEAIGFDDNPLYLNLPGHAFAGAGYFLAARNNGFGPFPSLGISAATAVLWELSTEYREIVSVGDLVVTPVGGFAIAEALFQVSEVFRKSDDRPLFRGFWRVLSGPSSLYPWRREPPRHRFLDEHGWTTELGHRFSLLAGAEVLRARPHGEATGGVAIGFDTTVWNHPAYDRAGTSRFITTRTLVSHLRLAAMLRPSGLADLELFADATYFALYAQSLSADQGPLHGWVGYVGLSTLYEHIERPLSEHMDQLGMVSPAGLNAHLVGRSGTVGIQLDLESHPVFGAAYSQGLAFHRAAWPPESLSSVLAKNGYYWAIGVRSTAALSVSFRRAEMGLAFRWYHLGDGEAAWAGASWRGPPLRDERFLRRLWFTIPLESEGLGLQLVLDRSYREGQLGDSHGSAVDSMARLQLVGST